MNCKICGKEIFYKDSDKCEECDSKIKELEKQFLVLKKRQIVLIILTVLIPIIFIFIINNEVNNVCPGPGPGINIQQIDAFNAQWTSFEGNWSGTQVKVLISKSIANAKTYEDEEKMILELSVQAEENSEPVSISYSGESSIDKYIEKLNEQYNKIKAKHTYKIEIEYEDNENKSGLIRKIIITW